MKNENIKINSYKTTQIIIKIIKMAIKLLL